MVEGIEVVDAAAAWRAAERVGLPCVVKLLSREVAHKSDVGGVLLNLHDRAQVTEAYDRVASIGGELGIADARVMVQPMMVGDEHDIELIIGAHRDVSFGPVVTVGFGGVLVDVLDDSVSLLPPFGRAEASRALSRLRGARLFAEFRGRPSRDLEALVDLLVRFSAAVTDLGEEVDEMELNPVVVRRSGQGAVGLDALVTLATREGE